MAFFKRGRMRRRINNFRRRAVPFRRRRFKKRTRKIALLAWKRSAAERKYGVVNSSLAVDYNGVIRTFINGISQGVGVAQHTGNELYARRFNFRFWATPNTTGPAVIVRLIAGIWNAEPDFGSPPIPDVGDILEDNASFGTVTAPLAFYVTQLSKRFTIKYDKIFKMSNETNRVMKGFISYKVGRKVRMIDDAPTNYEVFVVAISNVATANVVTLNFQAKMSYYDQ